MNETDLAQIYSDLANAIEHCPADQRQLYLAMLALSLLSEQTDLKLAQSHLQKAQGLMEKHPLHSDQHVPNH